MKLSVALVVLVTLTALGSSVSAGSCGFNKLTWTSEKGEIRVNGKPFHLKGVNWFGFETETYCTHEGWGATKTAALIDFVRKNNFNAVRLPFSVHMVLQNDKLRSKCDQLGGMKPLDAYVKLIDLLASKGILALVDNHRVTTSNTIPAIWEDGPYKEADFIRAWEIMMGRIQNKWNVVGIDLKNEPHDASQKATWNMNAPNGRSWNQFATKLINLIAGKFKAYKGLFFVEGVQSNAKSSVPGNRKANHFWGENLEGVRSAKITVLKNRVVYSPHVYGPDAHLQDYFKVGNFPANMPQIWDDHFGFVRDHTGNAVIFGEWGGKYEGLDKVWQDGVADYMIAKCFSSNFYWDLNPNSGDTGGLVKNDWKTPETEKLKLLARVQPKPSRLTKSGNKFCFDSGAYANQKCASGGKGTPISLKAGGNGGSSSGGSHSSGGSSNSGGSGPSTSKNGLVVRVSEVKDFGKEIQYKLDVSSSNGCIGPGSTFSTGCSGAWKDYNLDNVGGGSFKLPNWMKLRPGNGNSVGFKIPKSCNGRVKITVKTARRC